MKPSLERELKLYNALKRITQYDSPAKLRRECMQDFGLDFDEAIEYAYENMQHDAKLAIKGMRKPVLPLPTASNEKEPT